MVSKVYFVVCDDVAARPAFLPYKHSRTPHFQLRSSPKQLEALWRRRTLRQDKRLQRFARKSNLFRNASRMLTSQYHHHLGGEPLRRRYMKKSSVNVGQDDVIVLADKVGGSPIEHSEVPLHRTLFPHQKCPYTES